MTISILDKPLDDLRREVADLRQWNKLHDYDINKLGKIIIISKDSLHEIQVYQHKILQQLHDFEISLSDINEILRVNSKEKAQMKHQNQEFDYDIEMSAKLMILNAEALECRSAAVQLQQEANMALVKATEMEERANEELTQQQHEMKLKQQEIERERAAALERRVRLEEERQRLHELQIQQQQKERQLALSKAQEEQDQYADWKERDFMNNDQCPQCIFRLAPNALSISIEVNFVQVSETEHLLDDQEELIGAPIAVNFDSLRYNQPGIVLAIPYVTKRSTHRENVIKIRQSNGMWISIDTKETTFDSYKEKHFVECKLEQSGVFAVVSRLKRDTILIDKHKAGRFLSNADPRLTMEWPTNVSSKNVHINFRVLPVDLPAFSQFIKHFSSDCQGLIAVGPIVELNFDDVTLLKPVKLTFPILVRSRKKVTLAKPIVPQPQPSQETTTSQPSQREIILQQQQTVFKSVLGDETSNERLILLYSSRNDNTWHIDTNIHLSDSKTQDIITTHMQYLHNRMIIVRYDRQFTSAKQLQTTICLLEESLCQRVVSLILRRRLSNPYEVCFACCSTRCKSNIDKDLQKENFIDNDEQLKELILEEGQLLELRFRGNVLPIEYKHQSYSFAFNTHFPFYFQTNVSEIDKYSQYLSPFFYGFVQVLSKTTTKDYIKKKTLIDATKPDFNRKEVCLAELAIRLPKPQVATRVPIPKAITKFTPEGILTPYIFQELSASLVGDEWRRLACRLGMTNIRIEALGHEYKEDAGYYMLLTWFKRAPHSMDKDTALINALSNINRWDISQELKLMKETKRQEQLTASKDDQLRIFNAAFNRICQNDECIRIWKQIAGELLLSDEDIQRIEEKYVLKQERCLRSLEFWALNDSGADLKTLACIMRSFGFRSLSRELGSMV